MPASPKTKVKKPSDEEQVAEYMLQLEHPLKETIEMLRTVIKNTDSSIKERIKWNAPSYHYNNQDMMTFNHRDKTQVHLILHHPCIESISSPLLEGDFKSRRMCYIKNSDDAGTKQVELQRIIGEIIRHIKESSLS